MISGIGLDPQDILHPDLLHPTMITELPRIFSPLRIRSGRPLLQDSGRLLGSRVCSGDETEVALISGVRDKFARSHNYCSFSGVRHRHVALCGVAMCTTLSTSRAHRRLFGTRAWLPGCCCSFDKPTEMTGLPLRIGCHIRKVLPRWDVS